MLASDKVFSCPPCPACNRTIKSLIADVGGIILVESNRIRLLCKLSLFQTQDKVRIREDLEVLLIMSFVHKM